MLYDSQLEKVVGIHLLKLLNPHRRYGESEFSAFSEKRCQKFLTSHNNAMIIYSSTP